MSDDALLKEVAEFRILLTEYKKLMKYLDDRHKLLLDKVMTLDKKLERIDSAVWETIQNLQDNDSELNSKIEILNLRSHSK